MTTPLVARVLLADDHKIVRQGLCAILDRQPDLRVVEQAGDGAKRSSWGSRRRSTSPSSTSRCPS